MILGRRVMFILRMFIAVNKRVRIFIEDVIAIDFVFENTHNLHIYKILF